ncbi:MAG: hypothetical protein V1790_04305 [Planctomycetota bacterium]
MAKDLDVDAILKEFPSRFESRPSYSAAGDCVEYFFEDTDHFAERIDCWLTVYRAFDDRRVIGFKLKNVKALVSAFDALGLDVRISKNACIIRIQPLIAFVPWVQPESANTATYRDVLSRVVERPEETVDLMPT